MVRLAFGLDSLLAQTSKRPVEVVDGERDMPIGRAHLVRAAVVVEGELELLVLTGDAEEVVGCLQLAVPDDRQLAAKLQPQRLVERAALLGVGDAVHRV